MKVGAINSYSASFGNKKGKVADNTQAKPGTSQVEIPGLTIPASNDVKKALNTQKNIGLAGLGATLLAIGGSFIKNRAVRFVTVLPAIATTAAAGLIFFASAKKADQILNDTNVTKDTTTKPKEEKADAAKKAETPAAEVKTEPAEKQENAPAEAPKAEDKKEETAQKA